MNDQRYFGLTPTQFNLAFFAVIGAIAWYTAMEIRMLNTGQFPEELAGVMAKCIQ